MTAARGRMVLASVCCCAALAGCTGSAFTPARTATDSATSSPSASRPAPPSPQPSVTGTSAGPSPSPAPSPSYVPTPRSQIDGGATPAPGWLGTRVLPRGPGGYGLVSATPSELDERRIITRDLLPPPADGRFHATIAPVPAAVLARSTWGPACPVGRGDLRYLTVSFRGFDGLAHTGELLVHRNVADDVVSVFRRLFRARFPIEEMRITAAAELDLPPTGDGNNTSAFVCRPTRGSTSWSEHAYGRAVDINPFHNPYVRDGLVLPELASTYADRADVRPGMVVRRGPVTAAFGGIGWGWGGDFGRLKDWMHFSANGR